MSLTSSKHPHIQSDLFLQTLNFGGSATENPFVGCCEVGGTADRFEFLDMAEMGRNRVLPSAPRRGQNYQLVSPFTRLLSVKIVKIVMQWGEEKGTKTVQSELRRLGLLGSGFGV